MPTSRRYPYGAGAPAAPVVPEDWKVKFGVRTPTPAAAPGPAPSAGGAPAEYPTNQFWDRSWQGASGMTYDTRRGEIPGIAARLNWEMAQQAERDRMAGYNQLSQSWGNLANDPNLLYLRQALQQRYESGGPLGPGIQEQYAANLRDKAALGLQSQQRAMQEDFARRGLAGGLTGYQQAQLQQQAGMDLSSQLADWQRQAAMINEEAQRAALTQLQQQGMDEAQMRAAIEQALANVFLQSEYAPINMADYLEKVRGGKQRVL